MSELQEYEVEVVTTYYDVVRVKATSVEQARDLALEAEPEGMTYSETDIEEVYNLDACVYLIGPESRVYHSSPDCPALNQEQRYWEAHSGWLRADGSIKTRSGSFYRGRRPCKRCKKDP